MTAGCVVVKLGGSLLDLPDLAVRLDRFLKTWQDERVLMLVGGGRVADVVRRWDQRHELGDEVAHWLAIRALTVTSQLVAGLVPRLTVVTTLDACAGLWQSDAVPLLDPFGFLTDDETRESGTLPHTWDVTGDSIAARVAEVAAARQLTLLKSTAAQVGLTRSEAARRELVDRHFPQAARRLPRVFVQDLSERGPGGKPVELLPDPLPCPPPLGEG